MELTGLCVYFLLLKQINIEDAVLDTEHIGELISNG
jgi:hypothetical protein